MTPEKIDNLNKIELLQTPDLGLQLNFNNLEKTYGEPLTPQTKEIFQKIFDKVTNYDTKNISTAKNIIQNLVQYCKDQRISQTAIHALEGGINLKNTLPQKEINIGGVNLQNTNETVRLSFLDNLGHIKTYLKDTEDAILKQKFDEAEREGKKLDQEIAEQKGEEKKIDEINKEQKKEIEQLKQALSSVSKMQIEYGKYAKYLLKGKVEGEATGEDEKLNGTLLGGILTNKTYAKLRYLSVAGDGEKIKDEQGNEITVGEYKKTFETQYGSNIQKTLDDVEKIISDKESKLGSNTTKEPVVKGNPNGFDNSLSKLRGEFRSGNSKFDGYLDRKIEEVLSRERLTQDKGELEDIGLPWGSELRSEIAEMRNGKGEKPTDADNAKWEIRKNNEVIQNMSRAKIFAVIEGIVDSEADRNTYADALSNYINDTYNKGTKENHPPINPQKEMQLNMLFRKSFLVYTRMIMKNQIAEQYLGKVSDMISAGGDKLLIKEDKDAIEYDWVRRFVTAVLYYYVSS